MLRIKHLRVPALALAMILLVAATPSTAAQDDVLYLDAVNHIVQRNVTTAQVTLGTFVVNESCKAQITCTNVSYVSNNIGSGNVTFGTFYVKNGSRVERGDVIAEVNVTVEEVELDKLALQLEAEEANLEQYIDVNNGLLRDYERRIENAATAAERKTAQLLYDRLSVSFEEEKERRTSAIEALRTNYNNYSENTGKGYITAPMAGVVNGLNRFRSGDKLSNYTYMCTIYDTDSLHVSVSGGNDKLVYNMPVSIMQGSGDSIVSVEGVVTSNKNATLAPNLIGRNDYIEITGDVSVLNLGDDVTLRFKSVEMENALIVPRKAVKNDSGGDYVYCYEDGMSIKQYILTGGVNPENVWVVDGLSEGDLVVIN